MRELRLGGLLGELHHVAFLDLDLIVRGDLVLSQLPFQIIQHHWVLSLQILRADLLVGFCDPTLQERVWECCVTERFLSQYLLGIEQQLVVAVCHE
ncbi:MAG: hypothetical protein J6T67_04880 [Paludibacteraceae bacterium]|nr:hypothetical protein [Paludibacteraceae bacterium]